MDQMPLKLTMKYIVCGSVRECEPKIGSKQTDKGDIVSISREIELSGEALELGIA